MKTALTRLCVLTLSLLVLASAGCVKLKQAWTINPDGSGKVTMTIAVSEDILSQDGVPDPFVDLDNPASLMGGPIDGWVAFTEPVIRTQGGFKTATFTGYFEDLNQVDFRADGGLGRMRRSTYSMDDGSIAASNTMLAQVVATVLDDPEMADPTFRSALAPNLKGLEMVETYTLPGRVTDAEGFEVDGNTASATVNVESLTTNYPPAISGLDDDELVLSYESREWSKTARTAWENELAQVKAEWESLRNAGLETADAPSR